METSNKPCRCGKIRSCKECNERMNKVLEKLKERDKDKENEKNFKQ